MSLNVAVQLYRGPLADLQALATTGKQGVLAWTTDSHELYVDQGSGNPGTGTGGAWQPVANDNAVFQGVASQAAMLALAAKVGDLALRTDDNLTYILTAYPATTAANWVAIALTSGTSIQGLPSPFASNEFVQYIDTFGVQHFAQPSFADLSGQLSQTQLPSTIGAGSNLTDIDCGTF